MKPLESISVVRVELVKDKRSHYSAIKVEHPEELVEVLRKFLSKADREVFLAVNLGTRHEINSIHVVSMGSILSAIVHPREVFKAAILSNAYTIALAHNHPSGDAQPSEEDLKITARLAEAGKILDIKILDHIIIAGDKYLSFAEQHIGGF